MIAGPVCCSLFIAHIPLGPDNLGHAANGAEALCIAMGRNCAFLFAANGAGLGRLASCSLPAMAGNRAYFCAAIGTSLGSLASCGFPAVLVRLTLGGAANVAGLGLGAGCFLHEVTINLAVMPLEVFLQLN